MPRSRKLTDLTNKEAAFIVASITVLASVLQFIHGQHSAEGQGLAPATSALVKASEEILSSRPSPLHKAFTKSIAKRNVTEVQGVCLRSKATYLEQAVALIEYLNYLRTSRIGMDSDELFSSLAIYNIALAYDDLIKSQAIDLRRSIVMVIQDHLLRQLR